MNMVKIPKEIAKLNEKFPKNEGIVDGIYSQQVKCPHCGMYNIVPKNFLLNPNNRNVALCAKCNLPLIEDPYQRSQAQIDHHDLKLPGYLRPEQIQFIIGVCEDVKKGKPLTLVDDRMVQFSLRKLIEYRNFLIEEEIENKWSPEDNIMLETFMAQFKPILDYIVREHKLKIKQWSE